ncbi:hypothetical protein GCM10017688_15280 [Streptomyces ramulosus]
MHQMFGWSRTKESSRIPEGIDPDDSLVIRPWVRRRISKIPSKVEQIPVTVTQVQTPEDHEAMSIKALQHPTLLRQRHASHR